MEVRNQFDRQKPEEYRMVQKAQGSRAVLFILCFLRWPLRINFLYVALGDL
jgi:hypothetical protein